MHIFCAPFVQCMIPQEWALFKLFNLDHFDATWLQSKGYNIRVQALQTSYSNTLQQISAHKQLKFVFIK